jgi:hypothetical protein
MVMGLGRRGGGILISLILFLIIRVVCFGTSSRSS